MADGIKKVIVVGGGLSGLATARAILDTAQSVGFPLEVLTLEGDERVGGKIHSARKEGFLCEGGPNGFLDNKPSTMALVQKIKMADRLEKSNDAARKRFVFTGGRLQQLPEDPVNFLMSEILSIRGKLRLGMEFLLPQGDPSIDESVAEFVKRRLGEEALDKLIDPMSAGIYAGDPNVMSMKSCFPKVVMIEQQFGGLLKGMLAMQKMAKARGQEGPKNAGPGGVLWSFKEGTIEICDKLKETLGDSVKTNAKVLALDKADGRWTVKTSDGSQLAADAVVLATQAFSSAALIKPYAEEAAQLMFNIPYVPMTVCCVGFDKSKLNTPLDGFGFLIPSKEGRRILGALWSSSIFVNRAPEGDALFTIMVGGAKNPQNALLSDDETKAVVAEELKHTLGITAEPKFFNIVRWDRAIPQYVVGHAKRVGQIEARVKALGGLYLGGNAYYGIGINDCTARAEVLGPEVLRGLGANVPQAAQGVRR